MTHQENYNLSSSTVEELTRNGIEAIPELVRVILNNVMRAERSQYLQAKAYERADVRIGHANEYKPKTVRTKLGDITFAACGRKSPPFSRFCRLENYLTICYPLIGSEHLFHYCAHIQRKWL